MIRDPGTIIIIIIIIMKGHSLRRACLQPATNTQNSKPRPPIPQHQTACTVAATAAAAASPATNCLPPTPSLQKLLPPLPPPLVSHEKLTQGSAAADTQHDYCCCDPDRDYGKGQPLRPPCAPHDNHDMAMMASGNIFSPTLPPLAIPAASEKAAAAAGPLLTASIGAPTTTAILSPPTPLPPHCRHHLGGLHDDGASASNDPNGLPAVSLWPKRVRLLQLRTPSPQSQLLVRPRLAAHAATASPPTTPPRLAPAAARLLPKQPRPQLVTHESLLSAALLHAAATGEVVEGSRRRSNGAAVLPPRHQAFWGQASAQQQCDDTDCDYAHLPPCGLRDVSTFEASPGLIGPPPPVATLAATASITPSFLFYPVDGDDDGSSAHDVWRELRGALLVLTTREEREQQHRNLHDNR